MTSFAARLRADARLAILRILAQDPGYSHNHSVLRDAVEFGTAITLSEDEIKDHLAWLENEALVETEIVGRFTLAKLTDKGLSVAEGKTRIDGISRPRPEDL